MAKLHSHNVGKRGLDDHITDRRVSVARCSKQTQRAIKQTDAVARRTLSKRAVLVFVDDHKSPDHLACVVFSLHDNTTLVAYADSHGAFKRMARFDVRSDKRIRQEWLYRIMGLEYHASDPQRHMYHTMLYARNRTCYK
jgi:hypothetical protein